MAYIDERNGSYRIQWDLPSRMRPAGEKHTKGSLTVADPDDALDAKEIAEDHKHAITGEQVKALLDKKRAEKNGGPTFGDWAQRYIKRKTDRKEWEGKNLFNNVWRLENEILPAFGATPIGSITGDSVNEFLTNLKKRRRIAHATVNHYYDNIAQVINFARERGGLPSNPLIDSWNKKQPRSEVDIEIDRESEKYFELEEFDQLHANIRSDQQLLLRLLLETGMRFNEAGALEVRDLEPDINLVRIRQAWPGYYPGLKEEGLKPATTKNRGWRSAFVSDQVMSDLVTRAEQRKPDRPYIFLGGRGGALRSANFRSDHWNIAMNKAVQCPKHMPTRIDGRNGLEVIDYRLRSTCGCVGEPKWVSFTPHSLRHTCASWLIYLGESVQNVSLLLGHSGVQVTERVYVHQLRRSLRLSLDPGRITRMREYMPNLHQHR